MENTLVISINNTGYEIDKRLEQFWPQGRLADPTVMPIPLSRFRFSDGDWFILWDKKADRFYELNPAQHSLPLTVEWIKVQIRETAADKDRIELLIILGETMETLRTAGEGELKKHETALRKNTVTFLTKND